jgi:hypothetical protein
MATAREELELFQRLAQARDAGDVRAELEALRQLRQMQQVIPTGTQTTQVPPPSIGERAAARFVSNIISTPAALGTLLEIGGAGLQAAAGAAANALMGGGGPGIGERFRAAREQQAQQFPASLLQRFPSPTPEQVAATAGTIRRTPALMGQAAQDMQINPMAAALDPGMAAAQALGAAIAPRIQSEFQSQLERQQAMAEQHPIATGAGDVIGDIGTILMGRPALRRVGAATRRPLPAPRETVDIIDSAANRLARVTGFSRRLGAQAGEAGFEGALLAAMSDGDPLATAGWTAGAQIGGSLAMRGTQAFARYPWRTLGGVAVAHWVYRALAPGGQGPLEDVRDETIQTMLTTFGLGALAALGGAGRLAPGRTAARDRFIDAFDSIRRTPLASIISQISKAEEQGHPLPQVLDIVSVDPNAFGPEVRRRIERASRSRREDALINEVNSLMRSERFRRRFDELRQPQG